MALATALGSLLEEEEAVMETETEMEGIAPLHLGMQTWLVLHQAHEWGAAAQDASSAEREQLCMRLATLSITLRSGQASGCSVSEEPSGGAGRAAGGLADRRKRVSMPKASAPLTSGRWTRRRRT